MAVAGRSCEYPAGTCVHVNTGERSDRQMSSVKSPLCFTLANGRNGLDSHHLQQDLPPSILSSTRDVAVRMSVIRCGESLAGREQRWKAHASDMYSWAYHGLESILHINVSRPCEGPVKCLHQQRPWPQYSRRLSSAAGLIHCSIRSRAARHERCNADRMP